VARNSTARGKVVRRFGINIYGNPKYDKLLKRKPQGPGEVRRGRIRKTEYARQLGEKQKLKFAYGLSEKQFRNLFAKAKAMKGVAGHNMLILLERRLDNVVYRMGFASTRSQARQLVSHGHIAVNGRRVNIPSFVVKAQDVIAVKDRKASQDLARRILTETGSQPVPQWLDVSRDELKGSVTILPTRDLIPTIADEQLVVEYYAK
jgi:small subunit ribosomal protein S4